MNTFYVDTNNGSDANDGTKEHPWKTLTFADTQVGEGDTVMIQPGVYHERFNPVTDGVTWESVKPLEAIIDGTGLEYPPIHIKGNGVELADLKIIVPGKSKGGEIRNNTIINPRGIRIYSDEGDDETS